MQWIVSIKKCYFFFKAKHNFTEKLLMKCHISDIYVWEHWSNTVRELHDAEESYWDEKNITTWYDNEIESTHQGGQFWDFYNFSWSYAGLKSNLHSRTEIYLIGVTNPKIVYILLLFLILCIDWFFLKKNTYFERKFIKF